MEIFKYNNVGSYSDFEPSCTIIGSKTNISGWIEAVREHSKIVFFDLRFIVSNLSQKNKTYTIQCLIKHNSDCFSLANTLKNGYVVYVAGELCARSPLSIKHDDELGAIELLGSDLIILNTAKIPYSLKDHVTEMTGLTYRYYDLRNQEKSKMILARSRLIEYTHQYFSRTHTYIDTPLLTKSTPEGARDFLVFSRNYPGFAYALPQSPQLFKQMLMISGISNAYYQIAKCFRDEDLRANRQPEFTQIDVEMSFVHTEQIKQVISEFFLACAKDVFNLEVQPIATMTYHDAIHKFGNDSPDLRIKDLYLHDINHIINSEDRCVAMILKKEDHDNFNNIIEKLSAQYHTLKIFGYLIIGLETVSSNVALDQTIYLLMKQEFPLSQEGDVIFFGSDPQINQYFTDLRSNLAKHFDLFRAGLWPTWITEFPMFGINPNSLEIEALHHPFTSPVLDTIEQLDDRQNLLSIKSHSYDFVVNGQEICGGSMRTINASVFKKILSILGYDDQSIEKQFDFFIHALECGTPPHGGFAFGLERLLMVLTNETNIRNVIPFPKTQTGYCLLTSSPSSVETEQMSDLHLEISSKV